MFVRKAILKNYTCFKDIQLEFCPGINVFIGENGTGKTHVLKALYSACQTQNSSFAYKIVCTMMPDNNNLSRLLTKNQRSHTCEIAVIAEDENTSQEISIAASFNDKTTNWDAEENGIEEWKKAFRCVNSVFIPAKELLPNHNYIRLDDTYLDIINAAKREIPLDDDREAENPALEAIEHIMYGTMIYDEDRDEFYLKSGRSKQEFSLVADGIQKIGLLWRLIKNKTLRAGSVLFWDEPESGINPTYISTLVEILLALQRIGVQIFLSTHNYMLATYFDVRKTAEDTILFHSLAHEKGNNNILCEHAQKFADLKNNAIITAFNKLLDEIYQMQ